MALWNNSAVFIRLNQRSKARDLCSLPNAPLMPPLLILSPSFSVVKVVVLSIFLSRGFWTSWSLRISIKLLAAGEPGLNWVPPPPPQWPAHLSILVCLGSGSLVVFVPDLGLGLSSTVLVAGGGVPMPTGGGDNPCLVSLPLGMASVVDAGGGGAVTVSEVDWGWGLELIIFFLTEWPPGTESTPPLGSRAVSFWH